MMCLSVYGFVCEKWAMLRQGIMSQTFEGDNRVCE
jgi:hypothetical protein